MKIVYVAHPISGDVHSNVDIVKDIITHISMTEPDVVPFAPYLTALAVLNDEDPEARALGIRWNYEFFRRGLIDELRLYGDTLSPGMVEEIRFAATHYLPIRPMNPALRKQVEQMEFRPGGPPPSIIPNHL
jgi:hypothetical protein